MNAAMCPKPPPVSQPLAGNYYHDIDTSIDIADVDSVKQYARLYLDWRKSVRMNTNSQDMSVDVILRLHVITILSFAV